ncbi:TPA: hypothetical protein OYF94_001329 [Staphylococcus aureus]|nr:hypothetical protein [Staphylococcus aureus]MCM0565590.1 hypothetical protein [Staphylococcus aureus]MCM0570919.1 hypothetical protein [Staphylococcus aureus]HCW8246477.1 hypothetical protein [Staphylococcus aureus]
MAKKRETDNWKANNDNYFQLKKDDLISRKIFQIKMIAKIKNTKIRLTLYT